MHIARTQSYLKNKFMKKILVLTVGFPFPTYRGDKLRIVKICEELSKEYALDLLCLCMNKKELNYNQPYLLFKTVNKVYLPKYKSLFQAFLSLFSKKPIHHSYYFSKVFLRKLTEKKDDYDMILAHLPRAGQYLLDIRHNCTFLEMTDTFSVSYENFSKKESFLPLKFLKFIYKLEAKREKTFESLIIPKVNICSFISQETLKYLPQELKNSSNIKIYPNGVNLQKFPYIGSTDGQTIVYIGNMNSTQNILACKYFLDKIFPEILKEIPRLKFKIIGVTPSHVFRLFEKYKNVELTGKVQEIFPHVKDAFCAVCPTFFGNSMQNKILEYMALGIPVVTNYSGILGINVQGGLEILIAESPMEWQFHITELYNNEALRDELSKNAREYVEKHASWNQALRDLNNDVNKILNLYFD